MTAYHPFLEKALQNIEAAQILLEARLYDAAVSRAYFAAYQAARAALLKIAKRKEDDHGRVQAAFAEELVNRRKVYPGQGSVLNDLMVYRHAADYDELGLSAKRAQRQVRKAEAFVRAIEEGLSHDG